MYHYALGIRVKKQAHEQAIAIMRYEIIPVLKNLPGLVSLALIPLPDGEHITLLSEWARQTDAESALCPRHQFEFLRRLEPFMVLEPLPVTTEPN